MAPSAQNVEEERVRDAPPQHIPPSLVPRPSHAAVATGGDWNLQAPRVFCFFPPLPVLHSFQTPILAQILDTFDALNLAIT